MRYLVILLFPILLFADPALIVKVTNVYDGDFISGIDMKTLKPVGIRLWGIDAAELEQPYGVTAMVYLKSLVISNVVTVVPMGTDPFGRIIGMVRVNNTNVNHMMIQEGCAWQYDIGDKEIEYTFQFKILESEARMHKRGLWGERSPQSPFDFRNINYKQWKKKK